MEAHTLTGSSLAVVDCDEAKVSYAPTIPLLDALLCLQWGRDVRD